MKLSGMIHNGIKNTKIFFFQNFKLLFFKDIKMLLKCNSMQYTYKNMDP